jgi:diphthamide synthase (EF-2-diphthine--ammonia ligase)
MSTQKFSIVVEVRNGKPFATGFNKQDANEAIVLFNKLRDESKEAYLFQHPVADKRSKSAEQIEATRGNRDEIGTTVIVEETKPVAKEVKKPAKNKIEGVSAGAIDLP